MKLLAFGDVHLGASPDFGTAANPRLRDQEDTLHRIAKVAIAEQVDGVLFAGDAFHGRRPTPPQLYAWRGLVELLGDEGIGIVGVIGNHDVAAVDEVTAPEVVRGDGYYDIFRRPGVSYGLGTRDDATSQLGIACLPWAPIANLVAARNGGDRDALHAEAAALLIQTARGLREEIDQFGSERAVLLTHFSISGAVTPTGRDVGPDFGVVLPLADLEELGFDVVVAGHIHKAQRLDIEGADEPAILYTGSPCVIDWGEWNVEHGVWILDDEGAPWARFVPIEDRPFVTLGHDLTADAGPDPTETIIAPLRAFTSREVEDAVVRLRYTATAEQARRIDTVKIREALHAAGASRVFIQPTIVREDRARVEGVDESLGPLEALGLYCTHHGVNGDRQAAMAERTTRYLNEALS